MRDMLLAPRIFHRRYMICSEILPHYLAEVSSSESYFKLASEFTTYMKIIFLSMPVFARHNEQIPERLAEAFYNITRDFHKDRSLTDSEKSLLSCYLQDFGLRIINLYMHSTYVNQVDNNPAPLPANPFPLGAYPQLAHKQSGVQLHQPNDEDKRGSAAPEEDDFNLLPEADGASFERLCGRLECGYSRRTTATRRFAAEIQANLR